MPEISARDLRRLEALDEKLRKATADRRKQTSEARALRGRLQAAERTAAGAEDRLKGLLEENQRLADELAAGSADLEKATAVAAEAREAAEKAGAEAKAAAGRADEATAQAKRLQTENGRLAERIKRAEAQLAEKGVDPIVPAGRAAELINGFISELGGELGEGVDISHGELRLRVGMAMVDEQPGFVLPTPSSDEATVGALQELVLRFDKRLG